MKYSVSATPCKVSDSTPIVLRGDTEENIKRACEYGYDGVEIHLNSPDIINGEKVAEICKMYGVSISTIGTGLAYGLDGISFTDVHKEIRDEAIKRMKSFIKLAHLLNAKVILGSIRGRIPGDIDKSVHAEVWLNDAIKECANDAEKLNTVIVVEAINRYETNLLNTLDETSNFIRSFNTDKLKIHADTFHMNIEEEDIIKSLERNIDLIGHIHFADSNRRYPGQGHLDFKSIINFLEKHNYKDYIALECLPLPDENTAAKKSLEFIKINKN